MTQIALLISVTVCLTILIFTVAFVYLRYASPLTLLTRVGVGWSVLNFFVVQALVPRNLTAQSLPQKKVAKMSRNFQRISIWKKSVVFTGHRTCGKGHRSNCKLCRDRLFMHDWISIVGKTKNRTMSSCQGLKVTMVWPEFVPKSHVRVARNTQCCSGHRTSHSIACFDLFVNWSWVGCSIELAFPL